MARLPINGATAATPVRGKADLQKVLTELCPDAQFSASDTNEIYLQLASIIGQWSAEENRLDIAPLAKTFEAMGKELNKVAKILSGHETGLREVHDIEIVSRLADDPRTGSRSRLAWASRSTDRLRSDVTPPSWRMPAL